MLAPAASYSASSMPEAFPAPDWTTTSAPKPLIRLTVSGVAATRASPAPASRTMAMRIHFRPVLSGRGNCERQQRQHQSNHARRLRAAHQAVTGRARRNEENCERGEPVPHDAADRQPEEDVDDVNDEHDREMQEPEIGRLVLGMVVACSSRVLDLGMVGHRV